MTLDEHLAVSAELADGTAVLGLKTGPARVSKEKDAFSEPITRDAAALADNQDASQASAQKRVPVVLIRAIDMYAAEPKAPTLAGGVVTLLAVLGALAYTIYQFADYSHAPPITTSFVEWSDTQGPFPARIRCTAHTGCWISNRHNDRWSSNGDLVEARQQGCMYLQFGEEYVMNITFTQNTYNGFTVVWDHNEWEEGTTPGSGLQIMADTNYPAAPSGIFVLATPALGGVYLANFVQTTNNSAPEAKLRREWFITYVSSEKKVVPATTACAANLTDYMLANYTQASLRMPSQWYRVTVDPPNLLMTLIGNCGGALQLCLQAGAVLLLTQEFITSAMHRWYRASRSRRVAPATQPEAGTISLSGGPADQSQIYVDKATGQHFAIVGTPHAATGEVRTGHGPHRLELQSVNGCDLEQHSSPRQTHIRTSAAFKASQDGKTD